MRHRAPSPPLSLLLSLLLLASIAPALGIDPERVHLIDHSGHNFLFRTGDPTVASNPGPLSFAYADLDAAFRSVAAASNISLPSKYYLVDICLLSYELVEINTEVQFFKANASLGEFKSWPTFGTVINPVKVTQTATPTVFMIHCTVRVSASRRACHYDVTLSPHLALFAVSPRTIRCHTRAVHLTTSYPL